MNTISNSGRLGVSNVFAAALWTLDGAFEVAASGAVGVNLHQGAGQNLYTGGGLTCVDRMESAGARLPGSPSHVALMLESLVLPTPVTCH
jgi:hypothetical protein